MLQAIAAREGSRMTALQTRGGDQASRTRCATISGQLPAALVRELGIHRAQRLPAGVSVGRILTVRVAVRCFGPDGATARDSAVKTYNYVLRFVSAHDSGERLNLDAVLSGTLLPSGEDRLA